MDLLNFDPHEQQDFQLQPYDMNDFTSRNHANSPQPHPNNVHAGPQQTRKPASILPNQPTYDPKSLFPPKAGSSSQPGLTREDSKDAPEGSEHAARRMIENLHGVVNRDDAPTRKRKVQIAEDDNSEEERKKQKATSMVNGTGTGILSDHLKEERKRLHQEEGPQNEPIDLTNDDDLDGDELQVIRDSGNEEVCLGLLHCSANVHRVPSYAQSALRSIGKEYWPKLKVGCRREPLSNNSVIHLLDKTGTFGAIDPRSASALCPLLQGSSVNKLRLKLFLCARKRGDDTPGKKVSQSVKLEIYVYSPRNKAEQIGRYLSQKQLFLQTPMIDVGAKIFNPQQPQLFGPAPAKANGTKVNSQGRGAAVQRTVEEMRRDASSMFDSLARAEDLPEMEADKSIITSDLMPHQKQALHFLMEHERDDFDDVSESPQHSLWKYKPKVNGKPAWYHIVTGDEVYDNPKPIQGGILADVMGLGKTLSILALIAETREAAKHFRAQEANGDAEQNAKGTLIICPKSVLSNWEEQIRIHVVSGKFRVYTYHGPTRMQDMYKLSKYDIVLTTYNTAAAEMQGQRNDHVPNKRALASLNWFRIVLDEAHSIRTAGTQSSKACCALSSPRRWALTGTPVQNSLYDLGALVKFLQLKPFDDPTTWAQHIIAPLKNGSKSAVEHLHILVASVSLRRLKGTVGMPNRDEQRERLVFSEAEAALYKLISKKTGIQVRSMTRNGSQFRGKAYAHILKCISRLRVVCAHGKEMLAEEDLKEIEGDHPGNAIVIDIGDEPDQETQEFITEKRAYQTFAMMRESDAAVCDTCSRKLNKIDEHANADEHSDESEVEEASDDDTSEQANTHQANASDGEDHAGKDRDTIGYLTPCYHLICPKCIGEHEKEVRKLLTVDGYYDCQYCAQYIRNWTFTLRQAGLRRYLQDQEMSKTTKGKAARWDENTYSGPHTKVKALLEDLRKSAEETKALPPGEPPIRSVVFSSWTSYLDLIEYALDNEEIGSARIDGTMSVKQRSHALRVFNSSNDVTVLLVSIKAGGQGLNFTAANKVYVMEPQFNPGVEAQAVDRVHRIGQKRDVTIKHYIMKDSIEEFILKLQEKKNNVAKGAMDGRKRDPAEAEQQKLDLISCFK